MLVPAAEDLLSSQSSRSGFGQARIVEIDFPVGPLEQRNVGNYVRTSGYPCLDTLLHDCPRKDRIFSSGAYKGYGGLARRRSHLIGRAAVFPSQRTLRPGTG